VWTTTDIIKALWLFRKAAAPKDPLLWWNAEILVVFGPPAPEEMGASVQWELSELRWVYVRDGDFGEPYWMLRVIGG
jgi:hypothetical protein